MGQICFGTQNVVGARIDGRADQDWTLGSARGTHIRFLTVANGSTSLTERLRIDSSGRIGIGIVPSSSEGAELSIKSSDGQTNVGLIPNTNSESSQLTFYNAANNSAQGYIRYNNSDNSLQVRVNLAERLRIDSSGRLLQGLTTARANFGNNTSGVEVSRQLEGTSYVTSCASIVRNSNDGNDGGIILGKTRAGSVGGNTVVQAGDYLGEIMWAGADGTSLLEGARIDAVVESGVGNDDMPASLRFLTNGGSTSPAERLRITSAGNVLAGHTGTYGSGKAQVFNTAQYLLDLSTWSADANGPTIDFYKSRNATVGSATVVQSGDVVGKLRFLGNDGANSRTAAQITAEVDGTPGTNDMPGRLIFSTVPDDSTTVTERLRISADGAIKFKGADYDMTWRYSASALRLNDNTQLNLGTDDDGDIYHDGSQMIVNNATGTLKVRSDNLQLTHANNTVHVDCASGGAVSLYHNGSSKLATTSTGVSVTGTVSDSKGDLRRVIENDPADGAYQMVAADAGKFIHHNNTIKMPNAGQLSIGDMVTIYAYGALTLDCTKPDGGEALVYNAADASTGDRTFAARSLGTLLCVASNTYVLSGAGIS